MEGYIEIIDAQADDRVVIVKNDIKAIRKSSDRVTFYLSDHAIYIKMSSDKSKLVLDSFKAGFK